MHNSVQYNSPLGPLTLISDGEALVELKFGGSEGAGGSGRSEVSGCAPAIVEAVRWLDHYFSGEVPSFLPKISLNGTMFQQAVWSELLQIPYGKTITYKEIAAAVAVRMGKVRMSAQAVGQAVGCNPVGIIVPCHRVIGSNGSLTGYAWGLEIKAALLKMETRKNFKVSRKPLHHL